MIRWIFAALFILSLATPVSALEITPPEVPESGKLLMPDDTTSFSDALTSILQKALQRARPALSEAISINRTIIGGVLLTSILLCICGPSKRAVEIASAVLIGSALLQNTGSLIRLGADTVTELSEYGKLLLPVMTSALAAQGAAATSAALYAGTAAFNLLLSSLISKILVPMIYVFLILSAASSAIGQDILKKMRDFVKWFISWSLKTLLTVFTTYISITGVVSGTTDAIALKATKMTISSVVPVVGGILSEASDAVLVSAGIVKNTAGIYGILAALAVFLVPFLKIGIHYMILKVTAALCSLFGSKQSTDLVEDFSSAMGFLLAMTGSACLMLLISTVCFLKGAV